ncbi:MAG TPA: YihY/virulence factor BrkB family protein [Candidatus Dormibacteraeota bacterium]|jgi:membrane protein|nr:YihY/virulence factor BrkB family protein [Candidatus Dormibacteraeota bacterium]
MFAVQGRALLRKATASLPARLGRRFSADRCPDLAVLIGWNLMFASLPLVVVIAAIIGLVVGLDPTGTSGQHAGAGARVQATILQLLPGAHPDDLAPLAQASGLYLAVGFLGLLWTSAGLFGAMESAFSVVYRTPRRPFVRQKLVSFAMILLFAPLTGLIVGSATILPGLSNLLSLPTALRSGFSLALQAAFGVLAGTLLYTVIYYVVPTRRQSLRHVWRGALAAGVALEALTLAFPFYVALNKNFDRFGSSFAFVFLLLTFFYFLGMVTMLGAELNALLDPEDAARSGRRD